MLIVEKERESLTSYLTVCRDVSHTNTLLGLSERLEVQEMFENLQEERLDNLQDDLVTCINGEEGQGGERASHCVYFPSVRRNIFR